MSAPKVQLNRGHWILIIFVLVLLFSNLISLEAWQREQKLRREALAGMAKIPQAIHEQTMNLALDLQRRIVTSFEEMIASMQLSNRLTEEAQAKIRRLFEERDAEAARIQTETIPSQKLKAAYRVLDLDKEIMQESDDRSHLQSLHREQLFEKLKALGAEVGMGPPAEKAQR